MKKLTQAEFVSRSRQVHGDIYGYERAVFGGTSKPVTITCRRHGDFQQSPSNHFAGKGCKKCASEDLAAQRKLDPELIAIRVKRLEDLGVQVPLWSVEYLNNQSLITVVCPVHGETKVVAAQLWNSPTGCPRCSESGLPQRQPKPLSRFIEQAKAVHGNRYDYSLVEYTGAGEKVRILCRVHDAVFEQRPSQHLSRGHGCPRCAAETRNEWSRLSESDLVSRFREVQGQTYPEYRVEGYRNQKSLVGIRCVTHGWFEQTPDGHLKGNGCIKCGRDYAFLTNTYGSSAEGEVKVFLESRGLCPTQHAQIFPGSRREVDLYVSELNFAIEYNGAYYHSSKFPRNTPSFHLNKQRDAAQVGVRLIHIFDDEWQNRNAACRRTIENLVGKSPRLRGGARAVKLERVDDKAARLFYEGHHVQGAPRGGVEHYGLTWEGTLVACMSFSNLVSERGRRKRQKVYELVRFATALSIAGAATKLFAAFLRDHNPETVISYSDNRWFEGGVYSVMGFDKVSVSAPNYTYTRSSSKAVRLNKSQFQKSRLRLKFPDLYADNLTEQEICRQAGFYRVYDCGLTKWVWTHSETPRRITETL